MFINKFVPSPLPPNHPTHFGLRTAKVIYPAHPIIIISSSSTSRTDHDEPSILDSDVCGGTNRETNQRAKRAKIAKTHTSLRLAIIQFMICAQFVGLMGFSAFSHSLIHPPRSRDSSAPSLTDRQSDRSEVIHTFGTRVVKIFDNFWQILASRNRLVPLI